ncbi:MAG: beta strand repeat-containing protein, partial [Planctomycetota bacterium]
MKKLGILLLTILLIGVFSQNVRAAPRISGGAGFDTAADYAISGEIDISGGTMELPDGTKAQRDTAIPSPDTGDIWVMTDGSTDGDCTVGGGSTRNLCYYDGSAWVILGDGTSAGAGSGSMTTVTEQNAARGDADIVILNYGEGFAIVESPDTLINIDFDVTPSAGNATLVVNEDAIQVLYDTTDFQESTNGLYLGDSPTIPTSLLIGTDPADAGTIRMPNAGSIVWEDATEASITHIDNTGWLINSTHQLQFGDDTTYIAQLNNGYLDLVADTATRVTGAATITLGATDTVLIEGDTTRTGTNPVLDIDATFDTTTAADNVVVVEIISSRAATDTGSTIGINMELESLQTGVSTTLNEGIVITADNDWSPTGDTRLRGVRLNFQPDSFSEVSPIGVAGFVFDYDSTNLSANSGTVHAVRSDIDHTNATYSVDGIYSMDTSLNIGASTTTDGNVYVINNNTDIAGTVTGNVAGWYNDFGGDLDGVMNGYVVGTGTLISSGSTGTFGNAAGDIITGNLVVFDFTNATVGGTASGEYMSLTGPIPKGQFMDYHPDTVTATDDVMAIDLDIDRAAADTGGIVGLNVHITTGNMANAKTSYGIKLGFDQSASTTATSLLKGISIEDITGVAEVTETGLAIGTGWDVGINVGSGGIIIADTGTIGSASDTDAMTIAADGDVDVKQDFTAGTIASDAAITATTSFIRGTADLDQTDLEKIDDITNGTQAANKAVIADANVNTGISKITELHIGVSGSETQVLSTAAELNYLDNVGGLVKDLVTTAPITGAANNILVGADSDVTIALDFTAAWDFGGAASLEIPNGTSGTTDATGEIYLDTDGPDADYTGPVIQLSTNGATLGYLFTLTDAPSAADDNKIFKYDADTNLFSLEADDSAGTTAWSDIADPTAAGTITFQDTETATLTSATTASDQFIFEATGAFVDISIVKIEQKTGDATDGDLLQLLTADADVDHLLMSYGAADYVTHKIVDAGTYTIDVTSDGTAAVDIVDGLTAGSLTSDTDVTATGDVSVGDDVLLA